MKQHTTPTIIRKGAAEKPTKVNLNNGDYKEQWKALIREVLDQFRALED